MINKDISMVLCSCDNYEDAWLPFCKQLERFWPGFDMPVYLGAETKTFQYPGLDIRCPLAGGPVYKNWSKRLIKLLESIESEFVLFMLDDFWITEKVDIESFNRILNYMENNESMGFVCLKDEKRACQYPENERRTECEYPELVRCLAKEPFRITTQAGIWRRKYFIRLLRSHESAWYFETRATWRSKFYREKIYDVKKTVIPYPVGGFFWGGKCYADYLPLYEGDVTAKSVAKRGVINFGDTRTYPGIKKGLDYYYSLFLSVLPKW